MAARNHPQLSTPLMARVTAAMVQMIDRMFAASIVMIGFMACAG